jgi:hypothetical protein
VAIAAAVPLGLAEKAFGFGTAKSVAGLNLNLEAFEAQLGTNFSIKQEASTVNMRLVRVTNFATQNETEAGKEGFSLLFRGPKETTLKQDTYVIEHERLGRFSFLIVPVGTKDTRAPHYEAVINRLHS